MPYNLIIVDDEEIVRDGLTSLVDWSSMGFNIEAVYKDGRDAISHVDNTPVDVVLTDVRMTFVSGIELAKYVSEKYPEIKVVILSGYKEFEYARQAIQYNVKYYLLKPTDLDELTSVFGKIREELDSRAKGKARNEMDIRHHNEVVQYLREQFFTDLLMGALRNRDEMKSKIRLLDMDFDLDTSKGCVVELSFGDYESDIGERWKYGKERFLGAIRNLIQNKSEEINYFPVFGTGSTVKVIALSDKFVNELPFNDIVTGYFSRIKNSFEAAFNLRISATIRQSFSDIYQISAHSEPVKTVKKGADLIWDTIDPEDYERLIEQQKLFISYINAGNFEAVSSLLESFMEELKFTDIKLIRNFIIDLFAKISNKFKEAGTDLFMATNGEFEYSSLNSMAGVDDIYIWCKSMLLKVIECAKRNKDSMENQVIQKAKKYIRENFYRDITLKDVAGYVFLSEAYFSKLFKNQTGENFIDYHIKVRMDKAIELLNDPLLKVYNICEMVGYKNPTYFFRIFKNYTGYTPTEYRKNIFKGDEDGENEK